MAHLPGYRQPRKRRLRLIVSTKSGEPASPCVPPGIDSSAVSFAAQSGPELAILGSRRFAWQGIKGGKRCRGLARASSGAASRLAGSAADHRNLGP